MIKNLENFKMLNSIHGISKDFIIHSSKKKWKNIFKYHIKRHFFIDKFKIFLNYFNQIFTFD
jgi:hypothetical protein